MNVPQDTSAAPDDSARPAVARLVDSAGRDQPTAPRDVEDRLQSGGFFWLDLENPGEGVLA